MVAARRGHLGAAEAGSHRLGATDAGADPYEAVAGRAGEPELSEASLSDVSQTEPEDRLQSSWDDALTRGGLSAEIAPTFAEPSERALVRVVGAAQRGTFRLRRARDRILAVDAIGGAQFLMLERDDIIRAFPEDTLDAALLDGRVVAASDGCSLLPGVIFHPPEALALLDRILSAARRLDMARDELCDALLRMNHAFRCSSRVKVAFAYNPDALAHIHSRERNTMPT